MTTTPKAWPRNREVTQETRFVRAALGLHPQLIHERKDEISLWDQYLMEARYVGEVGIDAGPRYYRSLDLQKEVFGHVLQRCAREGNKVLSVHSVRSAKMVLDLIEAHFSPSRGTIILHWFSGSLSEAGARRSSVATSRSMLRCSRTREGVVWSRAWEPTES